MSKQEQAAVRWCYTKFNYDVANLPIIPNNMVKYRIEGKEICPTTQTPHIQGYCEFNEKIRFTALQKAFPGVNFTKCAGSPFQNFTYCSKDGNFSEVGLRPKVFF